MLPIMTRKVSHEVDKQPRKKVMSLDQEVQTTLTKPLEPSSQIEAELEKEAASLPNAETQELDSSDSEPFLKTSEEVDEKPDKITEEPQPVQEPTSQRTIEFELSKPLSFGQPETTLEPDRDAAADELEPYLRPTGEGIIDPIEPLPPTEDESIPTVSPEDQQRKANERIMKLKELSMKLRAPSGLADLENEPAYKRRNVDLDDIPHSSESEVSRFTLSEEEGEDGEMRSGLRANNSYLHDNVD